MTSKKRKSKRKAIDVDAAGLDTNGGFALRANLYEIFAKLDRMDPSKMSKEAADAWTEQYSAVTDAIRALDERSLSDINDQLGEEAEEVAAAIDNVETVLHGLENTAKILKAVGKILKSMATIAALA